MNDHCMYNLELLGIKLDTFYFLMILGSLELDKPPSLGSNRAESKSEISIC